MKNKLVTVLIIIMVVLALICAGAIGFLWYRSSHVFVERKAYSVKAEYLDLREEDISFDHFDQLHELLPECQILWNVPFQNGVLSSDSTSVSVSDLTAGEIDLLLKYLPLLKTVDASACSNYEILELLKTKAPEIDVQYSVSLGSRAFAPDTAELVLESGDYTYEALTANLVHLPEVNTILLKKPELTLEQIDALKEAYPQISFSFTVEILGEEYDGNTTELALADLTHEDVETVGAKFALLPNLEYVDLTDLNGKSSLEKADVKALMDFAPEAVFQYTFDFHGVTVSTDSEEVIVQNRVTSDNVEELRQALDLMRNCKRFVLNACQIPGDTMAEIRNEYRDKVKLVWRIYFGNGTTLTDAEVIRSVYDLVDDNSHDLVYCEDCRYMDIGHDEYLDSIDFVSGMTSLEVVIISGSPIKDLSPFSNCKNLRILEAANCGYITDVSPLAACTKLEMLNICYTKVTDLSALDDIALTHLQAKGLYRMMIPMEEQERFNEKHPDCWSAFIVDGQPYGIGWRYDRENNAMDWYKDIQKAFRYPNAPNDVGWYLD